MMEQDAAPAGGRRTLLPLPGGAGAPPGGTMTPCEELADGGRKACPRLERRGHPKGIAASEPEAVRNGASESAARRVWTSRWRAERRHIFARRCD